MFVGLTQSWRQDSGGKSLGSVESVKAVSEIFSPVSGEVTETNAALVDAPEKINTDPHGTAWLIKLKLADPKEVASADGRRRLRSVYRRASQGTLRLMRYLPKSPSERQEMLDAIGAHSIDELFKSIPEKFRLRAPLALPGPLSEAGDHPIFSSARSGKCARLHFISWRGSLLSICAR